MIQYDFPFVASMAYPGNSTCEIGMNDTESLFHITLILLRISCILPFFLLIEIVDKYVNI